MNYEYAKLKNREYQAFQSTFAIAGE